MKKKTPTNTSGSIAQVVVVLSHGVPKFQQGTMM